MKKAVLITILSLTFSNFYSQITIEKSDFVNIGDKIKMMMFDFANNPANASEILATPISFKEYDNDSQVLEIDVRNPNDLDGSESFSGATFAYQSEAGMLYYKVTNNKVEMLGIQGVSDMFDMGIGGLDFVFPEPITVYNFPLNYNNKNEDDTNISFEFEIADLEDILSPMMGEEAYTTLTGFISAIKINAEFKIKTEFDEFGTVNFDGNEVIIKGDFEYLRENRKYIITPDILFRIANTVPLFGGQELALASLLTLLPMFAPDLEIPDLSMLTAPQTINSYSYWTKDAKYPLAEVVLNSAADTVYSVSVRCKGEVFELPSYSVLESITYPNPTNDVITFKLGNYIGNELSIYSVTGALVSTISIDEESVKMDISKYNSGTYVYQISDNKRTLVAGGKFIKE